ncbi:MAG: EAL domain-containing protein [Clostridiales bacterium]|nr:EAL domain-containing protein [Clostridiales bacterium]
MSLKKSLMILLVTFSIIPFLISIIAYELLTHKSLILIICIVYIIIIAILANYLSNKFIEPIISLRDTMRTASNGNLEVKSSIRSKNELGELSKSFNKMMHIINRNYEDLTSLHNELLSNEEQLRSNYDHIEFLAYHDVLTGLPNKIAFTDYINGVLSSSNKVDKMHAIYFFDLDNFKTINDTLGHEYGDDLLIRTAQILQSIIDGKGLLARAGGDEFLLFYEDIKSVSEAVDLAAQIIKHFQEPIELNNDIVFMSMSIGIAIYPDNGLTPNALIKNSDIAMYKSKDTGKNKYTIFNSMMEEELNRHTLIIDILRSAIENNELYIRYQPLVDLQTNQIIGLEALARIDSEKLGPLSPSEFIPIAEESGLIVKISNWIIREACLFNKKLLDRGITSLVVSVNISSIHLNRPEFIKTISNILDETQLPPNLLELELTESTLVSSVMDAASLLSQLHKLGVKVSLDDFGTGYSSLNYLTRMPINTLKIDKSFIDNISYNDKDAYIANTIIQLAHRLNIKVVAEGVETKEQLELLRQQNCDMIQGHIISKPLLQEEIIDLIQQS